MAVDFIVVEGEMLYADRNSVALHAFYIIYSHFSGEIRVFAHIFKVASA